jgi:hypothetical protein
MKTIKTLLVFSLLVLSGCFLNNRNYEFEYETIISDTPTNLGGLNSSMDDYNSDLPYPASRSTLFFSTNRNSTENNFDIICKYIDISYHKKDDILNFSFPTNVSYSSYERKLLPLINSRSNEYGPYTYNGTNGWDYFFYANNESGDYDIKLVYTTRLDWGTYNAQERLFGPVNVVLTNSEFDDLYPAIHENSSKLMFCSNRENQFDIYSIDLNAGVLLQDYFTGTSSVQAIKVSELSSTANDKCPSVKDNLLVFASDKEGGSGGYDLYYSKFKDNKWSTPVNFGNKINSVNDEFRPITFSFLNFNLMIFSSNRTGGKGGYDLYCVKIEDLD